jgi:N-acetylneuraminic acid mutarotase
MQDFNHAGASIRVAARRQDATRRDFLRSAAALGAGLVAGGESLMRAGQAFAQARSPWSEAKQFPAPFSEVYGLATGGKLFVFGGLDQGTTPKGFVYAYDADSDSWAKKQDMPRALHHTAQADLNGKIYMFGGFAAGTATEGLGWRPTDIAAEYDPTTDSWKQLPAMPTPRGAAIAVSLNNKVYVIGGGTMPPGKAPAPLGFASPHNVIGTVEVFDPADNSWRKVTDMPTPRNHVSAVGAIGGKIHVIGGRIGSVFMAGADNLDIVETYDPATDSWSAPRARMPTPRSGGGWGVYNDKIYVGGGELRDDRMLGAVKSLEAYDPVRNLWTILPPMPISRHGCSAGFIGSKLHFVGGDVISSNVYEVSVATPRHDVFDAAI